jgi:hypothetical protein
VAGTLVMTASQPQPVSSAHSSARSEYMAVILGAKMRSLRVFVIRPVNFRVLRKNSYRCLRFDEAPTQNRFSASRCLLMIVVWISLAPSPISRNRASRRNASQAWDSGDCWETQE